MATIHQRHLGWDNSVKPVAEIESGKLHWDEEYLRHHFEMTRTEHTMKKGENQ